MSIIRNKHWIPATVPLMSSADRRRVENLVANLRRRVVHPDHRRACDGLSPAMGTHRRRFFENGESR